ncbi:urease accessory protein UreE [Gilvimarinus polysaccharolyticus]|uniref:urease accessory protein UreE n=1 Tax=Gilvimarinus polysaccharolyticus TaxID=863921 RepID=UPI000673C6AD|nr:urease accessory protein UreE [Gilvimarinus polysaccharolyticus]
MLEAYSVKQQASAAALLEVEASFEQRQKSRYRTSTRCGQPLGWFLERGHVLLDGEVLECSDGQQVRVVAALEPVSQVSSDDALALTRAAYHLGNRHMPLQIGAGFLRYQHDHVLDLMVEGLGLKVSFEQQPFQPENGAYHGKSHGHAHSHTHSHEHSHGAEHGH